MDPMVVLVLTLAFAAFLVGIIFLSKTPKSVVDKAIQDDQSEQLDFIGHLNAGNKAFSLYDFHEALYHFQKAAKLNPNEDSVHFKIARIHVQQENYTKGIESFNRVIAINPNKVEAYFELARTFKLQGNLKDAQNALKLALKFDPAHEDSLKLKLSLTKLEKDITGSAQTAEELYRLNPQNAEYAEQLSELYESQGRLEAAEAIYRQLIANQEISNTLYYQGKLGQLLVRQERYEDAKIIFEQVFALGSDLELSNPKLKEAMAVCLCNLGAQEQNQGNFPLAIQYYQEALGYSQTNEDIYFNLGKAFLNLEQTTEALENLHRALSLNPRDAEVCYELGRGYDAKGDLQESARFYEMCLSLNNKYAEAAFGLGTIHGVQGNLEQSVKYLTEAIKINPQYVDAIYNLAVCQEQLGQNKKAVQLYKKVLDLDPAHQEAKTNMVHLQKVLK